MAKEDASGQPQGREPFWRLLAVGSLIMTIVTVAAFFLANRSTWPSRLVTFNPYQLDIDVVARVESTDLSANSVLCQGQREYRFTNRGTEKLRFLYPPVRTEWIYWPESRQGSASNQRQFSPEIIELEPGKSTTRNEGFTMTGPTRSFKNGYQVLIFDVPDDSSQPFVSGSLITNEIQWDFSKARSIK